MHEGDRHDDESPLVSVVIPTRNRRSDLVQAIRSALDQRDVALEVIVVDEASDDGTAEMLALHSDRRVRTVRHERPLGSAGARNAGIEAARGEWIAFLDDDDLWAPAKLSRQLAALSVTDADWSFTSAVMVDQSLQIIGSISAPPAADLYRKLLSINVVPGTPGVVVRADLVRKVGGMRSEYRRVEDWDLWIRLAQHGEPAVIDQPLWAYRISRSSSSHHTEETVASTERLLAEFAAERERLGVSGRDTANDLYLARQDARSGRRFAAARRFAATAWRGRQPKLLVQAAVSFVAPRVVEEIGWRQAAKRVPPLWRAEAETWLPTYRNR